MVSVRQLAPQAVCLVDQVLACFKRLRQAVASEQKPVVLEVTKFNMHLEFYLFWGGGGGGGAFCYILVHFYVPTTWNACNVRIETESTLVKEREPAALAMFLIHEACVNKICDVSYCLILLI